MTMPKQISKTLKGVLDHPLMETIMDRSKDVTEVVDEVKAWWDYDLDKRKPGPAYTDDGVFKGTDLDLACFLHALADRGAPINLPEYKSMRKAKLKEGQTLTSKENRHGAITGLVSNKKVFSFSVRIKDMNVMSEQGFGDFRNFTITDLDGEWYDGWKTIQFIPSADENKFLTENKLWSGHSVVFNNFVHPNRWISFYGHRYFITKTLIARMTEEAKNLNSQIKRMLTEGVTYPKTGDDAKVEWPTTTSEKGKSIKVQAFEVEVDIPENESHFPFYEATQENLVMITRRRKSFVYKIGPVLKFATRATELAYVKYGENKMPAWLKNVKWEYDYKTSPRARTKWDRLVLFQDKVGERGISIRKRLYKKSEIVAMDYEG